MAQARHDWQECHTGEDQLGSPLARRLATVQQSIAHTLAATPTGPIRVMSMCAGEGHDLLGVLEHHALRADVVGRLVELDPVLAATAREHAPQVSKWCMRRRRRTVGIRRGRPGGPRIGLRRVRQHHRCRHDARDRPAPHPVRARSDRDLDAPRAPARRDPRGPAAFRRCPIGRLFDFVGYKFLDGARWARAGVYNYLERALRTVEWITMHRHHELVHDRADIERRGRLGGATPSA